MKSGKVAVAERFFIEFLGKLWESRDAFLRELLSNAHAAINRRALRDQDKFGQHQPVPPSAEITVQVRPQSRQIRIDDNGAGMTRSEVEKLGELGVSLTDEFRNEWSSKEADLSDVEKDQLWNQIGYWGVGLYSGLTVASSIQVITRAMNSDETLIWNCQRDGNWTISDAPAEAGSDVVPAGGRDVGTTVLLCDVEVDEFLQEDRLQEGLVRYADFFPYPVRLGGMSINRRRVPWDGQKPADADLTEFFRVRFPESSVPLASAFFRVDFPIEARGVLYLTEQPQSENVTLVVQRVPLRQSVRVLPEWAEGVICGVVECDLPLSPSRELPRLESQEFQQLRQILAKQVLRLVTGLEERPQTLRDVWRAHAARLTMAVHSDEQALHRLGRRVLLFPSSRRKLVSLNEYIQRAVGGRSDVDDVTIWYAPDEWRRTSFVDALDHRDIEVVFIDNPGAEHLLLAIEQNASSEKPRLHLRRVDEVDGRTPDGSGKTGSADGAAENSGKERSPNASVNVSATEELTDNADARLLRESLQEALGTSVAGVSVVAFEPVGEVARLVRPKLPQELREIGPTFEAVGPLLNRFNDVSREQWPEPLRDFVEQAEQNGITLDQLRTEIDKVQRRRLHVNWKNPDVQRLAQCASRLCDGTDRSVSMLRTLGSYLLLLARLSGVSIDMDELAASAETGRDTLGIVLDLLEQSGFGETE